MNSSQIIDALGGTAKVAELFEISMAAVSQWREDGIPKPRMMFLELKFPEIFHPENTKKSRRSTDKGAAS